MRSPKFRIWNEKEQTYCYFSEPDSCQCHHVWIKIEGGLCSVKHHNPHLDQYVLEQFTGVKDGKNFEIYEGDILKIQMHDEIGYGVVIWDAPAFRLKHKSFISGEEIVRDLCPKRTKNYEVVGTVRKMKDLMTYKE